MARIRIEGLPLDTPLTSAELMEIEGAGRSPVRLGVERLETRDTPAATFANALTPALLPTPPAAQEQPAVRAFEFGNDILVAGNGNDTLIGDISTLPIQTGQGGRASVGPVNPLLAPSQAEANQAVSQHYAAWKAAYVTAEGADGHLRVKRTENGNDTVSEGIGYGMLLAAYNGDRATFDGLWAYAKAHQNGNGLMKWHLDPNGKPIDDSGPGSGSNSATDAEEDMAMALVVADKRWGGYKADATNLINAVMTHEVEPGTNVLKPGDVWGGSDKTNPSYFAPAYYKAFQAYTGDARWAAVTDKAYEILTKAADPTTGLVADWVNAQGQAQDGSSYSYDAMRTPWRIATDAVWNNDPRAVAYLTKVNAFFKQQGVTNIKDKYTLGGQPGPGDVWHNAAAVSMAATAAVVDSDAAYRQSFWSETLKVSGNNYYNDSLRALSLLLVGNQMTKP